MLKRFSLAAVLTILVLAVPSLGAQKVRHPKLHAALYELREARRELAKSTLNYAGKKKAALKAIDHAVISLKLILAVNDDTSSGLKREKGYYKKWKDHPHVRSALADLRDARRELVAAKTDFQGNKKRALKDIDEAIEQLGALLKAVK